MDLIKTLCLSCILISPFSQAKKIDEVFHISKNGHFSTFRINHFKGTEMSMEFKFDESVIYTSQIPSNQADTNKLWGFSDCNKWEPQKDSARFGWRWYNKRIEIMAIVDYKFVHYIEYLGTTEPGQWSSGIIRLEEGKYAFYYKDTRLLMDRHCEKPKFTGYRHFPYFGGDEKSPHAIRIHLRDL